MDDNHNYMRQLENLLNLIQHQNMVPVSRRTSVPSLQQITSSTARNTYPGMYNIVTGRPCVGGFRSIYSPEHLNEQSMTSLLNPSINMESEDYGPTFDSIKVIVNAFNSLNVLVLSIYNTVQMAFSLVSSCSDFILKLRLFMLKLRSSAKSIKVIRWFLTKMIYLLNIIKRSSGSNTKDISKENSGSRNNENACTVPIETLDEEIHSVEGSWHLFVFTGLLSVTPYLIHKIMGTTISISDSGSINGGNGYYNRSNRFYNQYNGFQNVENEFYHREVPSSRSSIMNSMVANKEIPMECEDWMTDFIL